MGGRVEYLAQSSVERLSKGRHDEAMSAINQAIEIQCTPMVLRHAFVVALYSGYPTEELQRQASLMSFHIPQYRDYIRVRPDRPIRVGYMSSHLRAHSTAHFLLPLLESHTPDVDVYLYNLGSADETTKRMGKLGKLRPLAGMDIDLQCRYIRRDSLDVLVYLDGHLGSGMQIMERRPVPNQVSYLGYPASTYSEAIDYRIVDAPEDGTESCAYVNPFLAFTPLVTADITPRLDGTTFGAFTNYAKVDDDTLDAWSEILDLTPNSRLTIKSQVFKDRGFAKSVERRLGADRCECRPACETREEHIEMYNEIDITLDPIPYSGTTTTCESLHMGVPVVTLQGQTHRSRVSALILQDLEPSWINSTIESYIDCAVRLASDLPDKESIRKRFNESSITDGAKLAQKIEDVYRTISRSTVGVRPHSLDY